MNHHRLFAAAILTATVVGGSLTGAVTSNAEPLTLPNTGSISTGSFGAAPGPIESSKAGMVLNVINNSSYDLQWIGGTDPANTPKTIIPANGGTDRIVWHGTNLELAPTWQVVGTQYNVFPRFGVPLIGGNGAVCTMDEISPNSPVGMSHCDIGSGWDPDAHVTFSDVHLTMSSDDATLIAGFRTP